MTIKFVLDLGSQILLLTGLVVSIWGTFQLTRFYHSYDFASFTRETLKLIVLTIFGKSDLVSLRAKVANQLGEITPEQKANSLIGIYWIFIGFVFQVLGTGTALCSVLWDRV